MKTIDHYLMRRALAILTTGLALGGMLAPTARADMYRMTPNAGGGIPAQAVINPLIYTATNCTLSWYGLQGWYTVQSTPNLLTGPWTSLVSVEATDFAWSTTVPNTNGSFFRLSQANSFAGSGACGSCHGDKYTTWRQTGHGVALSLLTSIGMGNNASCLPCHTVGFGQPTGYTNSTLTPHLANVGCENCHGAAGWHKDSDHSVIRPVVSIDPAICGSCHQDSHHPTYEEYGESLHSQVNDDVKYGFNSGVYYTNTVVIGGQTLYGYYVTTNANGTLKTNATTGIISSSFGPANNPVYDAGQDRQVGCGMCHSGATRMAMLGDYEARLNGTVAPLSLPSGKDSGAWGPTCAVCHDPHSYYNTAQLRNPTWSSNYFTMATTADKRNVYSTNFLGVVTTNVVFYGTTFASMYDPNVNMCGQCHNTRGARWDGLAYGLITTPVVGATVTNQVRLSIPIYSYTTNTYGSLTYILTNIIGYNTILTNMVVTPTNNVVTVGLTTNVTGYSRAPHNSVQYNMLVGILQPDYLNTTNGKTVYTNGVLNNGMGIYATHSGVTPRSIFNTNQCATCHVPNYVVNPSTTVLGHSFDMDVNGCALGGCHTSGFPDWLGTQAKTTNNIARVVDLLNRWATNNGPAILTTNYSKYKQNSWEFTAPGVLASLTNAGPSAADQLKLPAAIRQARFNTYMVRNDGSFGVHNPTFTPLLLKDAEIKVLSQFTTAKFTANSPDIALNGTVIFTNLNAGVTASTWNFGDGSPTTNTTAATVAHKYTTVGTWSVTLTATDSSGTETLTRNNYITVYDLVVPSFTFTPGTLTHTVTVNFTNTSLNAEYGKWSFYDTSGYMATSNRMAGVSGMTASFTYTNAGTYKVLLQASNPGGSANATNTITIN
jgi:PKD repeat protein